MSEENIKEEEVNTNIPATAANEDKLDSTSIISDNINEGKVDNSGITKGETDENKIDSPNTPIMESNEDKIESESTMPIDLSKVKIRHVLRERFKKGNLGFKKIIAFILVGIVCFGAGFFTSRASIQRKLGRNFNDKPGIKRNVHGNFKGNKKIKEQPKAGAQAQQQGQSPAPAQDQSGGQSKN